MVLLVVFKMKEHSGESIVFSKYKGEGKRSWYV